MQFNYGLERGHEIFTKHAEWFSKGEGFVSRKSGRGGREDGGSGGDGGDEGDEGDGDDGEDGGDGGDESASREVETRERVGIESG